MHMETYLNLEASDTWKEFQSDTGDDDSSDSNEEDIKENDM